MRFFIRAEKGNQPRRKQDAEFWQDGAKEDLRDERVVRGLREPL